MMCDLAYVSHMFGTMYARVLKFYICVAYEKLADPYFVFPIGFFIPLDLYFLSYAPLSTHTL